MKFDRRTIFTFGILALLMAMTVSLPLFGPIVRAEGLSALPWKSQGLQSWGRKNVAVDFGARGLWSYDGAWIQLSRLDPQHMTGWGDGNLAIDFGVYGLWTYDGQSWLRISL